MKCVAQQMMPAAPGMYRLEAEDRKATLVVMWVLTAIHNEAGEMTDQQLVGLTLFDLQGALEDVLLDRCQEDDPVYTTQVPKDYVTRR